MKKLSYVMMIALAGYFMQGCNSAPKDAKENADSLNKTKDTTSNVAETGGIAVINEDAKFATMAASGGMAEVALGNLAKEKSTTKAIQDFGNMMVIDHGNANDELKSIAKSKNITLPDSIDADHKKKIEDLSKMSKKDFDKAYIDAMIDGHKKTLDLMNDEAKNGKDAELKAFAAKVAPTVQMHLNAIHTIEERKN